VGRIAGENSNFKEERVVRSWNIGIHQFRDEGIESLDSAIWFGF
jgi:hypothetical protein